MYIYFLIIFSFIVKGAIDSLKWGREAEQGGEFKSKLKRACGTKKEKTWTCWRKEGKQTASIGL